MTPRSLPFPILIVAALSSASQVRIAATAPGEIARVAYLMGTRATLITYDTDRGRGTARLDVLLRVLERTESELSTWREDSLVTRLNRSRPDVPATVPPAACALFAELERWTRETAGAFDPAVGALAAAWGLHAGSRTPSAGEVRTALAESGWHAVHFDRRQCTVTREAGAAIDVGGFGKGEALDRAERALADEAAPWLIDLGGQVMVRGAPPATRAWTVPIAHPRDRERPVATITLPSGSLATSGGSERDAYVSGRRVGHIIDPRTGRPATFTGSVIVWHARGLVADVLSTALYVMGPDEGVRWAERHGTAACFLIADGDRLALRPTRHFTDRFGALHADATGVR